ncbi:hypothetical protein IEN85_00620 [Pelagicoccus sp. NFK12]|uniref:Uncharacterized protein n=1 Tax=Pelagicoccus enzymogenes TaxID=2773457 RepID=A0A927F690_9BACT|nr:hypothetical protein [Pelagicoccus enzymogenes]MBD5777996.1 hypothetical protein [Pelagicoccus enzymogenes]
MISSRTAKTFWLLPVFVATLFAIRIVETPKFQLAAEQVSSIADRSPLQATSLPQKTNEEAEIQSLQEEITALAQRVEKRERVLAQRKKEQQYTQADSISHAGLTPEQWSHKGFDTPFESIETLIYSAASGDLETMKTSLVYSPECEALAKRMFESLPLSVREEQGSFASIMAMMTIDQVPLAKARLHAFKEITDEAREVFMVFTSNLDSPKSIKLDLIQMPDQTWKALVPPQAVHAYADKLGIEFREN